MVQVIFVSVNVSTVTFDLVRSTKWAFSFSFTYSMRLSVKNERGNENECVHVWVREREGERRERWEHPPTQTLLTRSVFLLSPFLGGPSSHSECGWKHHGLPRGGPCWTFNPIQSIENVPQLSKVSKLYHPVCFIQDQEFQTLQWIKVCITLHKASLHDS